RWNLLAFGFVYVDIGISWVAENGPNVGVVSGLDSTRELRFTAVLELDRPASMQSAKIIGGEYVDDASAGSNRLKVAPFVWVAHDAGADSVRHNPYVDFTT